MAGRNDATTNPRPPLAIRLTGGQWLAIDCVVVAATVTMMISSIGWHGFGWRGFPHDLSPWAAAFFASAATLPVAVRRIWPLSVAAVVATASAALMRFGRAPGVNVDVMLGMACYTAAVRCRRPAAVTVLAVGGLTLGAVALTTSADPRTQAHAVRAALVAGALWFIGDSVRERRRYLAGLAEQAAQGQRAEAERSRVAVREERVRIARELHDVVAHSLSVVTVQAGIGRKIAAVHPAEALRMLRSVEVTGRSALEELRRILGLLRDDADRPSLAPTPGIGDLGGLADSVRAAGTPVRLAVTGDAAALPPAAALTVYRIVQEALTNVVKHAPGAQAAVRVAAGPDGARITVTDNGRALPAGAGASPRAAVSPQATAPAGVTISAGSAVPARSASAAVSVSAGAAGPVLTPGNPAPGTAAGHAQAATVRAGPLGILGMRERVAAFGGTLDAGPLPGGGFHVTAFLPSSSLTAGQVA